ncbi:uncharacterized protein K02A2.6-like [Topomyia yanbarensis]|uniref:uncharacterized protein K02A2.6-like n=1 Tax=Topomyia yanbarensis TaxID=2498891 RepID=UPI00273BEB28|nr:uncharacterized protein K02A2.6-like [Topomyia yanbarensis]
MLLKLQRYNLTLEFVTGKDNVVADALSRAVNQEISDTYEKLNVYTILDEVAQMKISSFLSVSDARLTEIAEHTAQDQTMQIITKFIQQGWPKSVDQVPDGVKIFFNHRHEFSSQDGLVFRNDRIVVPYTLRRQLIDNCHASHNEMEATLRLAPANLFWPGKSSQVKDVVRQCAVCAKFAASQANPPMKTHLIPVYPFQMVSFDVFFADYKGIKHKFLVTVDHDSDFFEVNVLKDLTLDSVVAICKENFARHGIPQLVLSDNGTNFVNRKMIQFASDWCFKQVTSAPHHQQANGKSEAAVKIAKHLLKKSEKSGSEFWYALLHWRNIPSKIGSSSVARLFSRSTGSAVPTSANRLLPKVVEDVPSMIEVQRKRNKQHYDKKIRYLPELQVGAPVYVQLDPASSKIWTPGTINNRLNERSYLVDVGGNKYRRSLVHLKLRTSQPQHSANNPENSAGGEQQNNKDDDKSTRQKDSTDSTNTPVAVLDSNNLPQSAFRTVNSDDSDTQTKNKPAQEKSLRPRRETRLPARLMEYQLNL